jgi:hypothetical protein
MSVMGLRPLKGMKIADPLWLCPSPVTTAEVSAALPFVIPSINRKVLSRA